MQTPWRVLTLWGLPCIGNSPGGSEHLPPRGGGSPERAGGFFQVTPQVLGKLAWILFL